jgi:hypothetical protein
MTLPNIISAASIYNTDSKPHLVKGRTIGGGWIHTTIHNGGTRYFRCRYGCQVIVIKTGSEIVLESDADIVISNGELRVR